MYLVPLFKEKPAKVCKVQTATVLHKPTLDRKYRRNKKETFLTRL